MARRGAGCWVRVSTQGGAVSPQAPAPERRRVRGWERPGGEGAVEERVAGGAVVPLQVGFLEEVVPHPLRPLHAAFPERLI